MDVERIQKQAPVVAPGLPLERRLDLAAGRHRAVPPGASVFHHQMQCPNVGKCAGLWNGAEIAGTTCDRLYRSPSLSANSEERVR